MPDQQQYGPNLQASPYLSSYKNVIFVLGYYENRLVCSREMDRKMVVAPSTVAEGCGKSLSWFLQVWKLRNLGGEGGGEGFISSGSFSNSKKSMFDSSDYLIPGTFPILNVATLKFPLLNILGFLFYFIYFIFLHCLA